MKKSFYASTALAVALTSLLLACGGGGGSPGKIEGVGGTTGLPISNEIPVISATSPDNSISISVGSGDTISTTARDIKYRIVFAATVTDTDGRPIKGAKVNVTAQMLGYRKGTWRQLPDGLGFLTWQQDTLASCANEDLNGNNILDVGEDTNNSGSLEPRIASVVVGAVDGLNTTDSQGIVYIAVEYAKADATWLDYRLTVSTTGVLGATEVTTAFDQRTAYAVGDESKDSSPFRTSRFGVQAGCNNTN